MSDPAGYVREAVREDLRDDAADAILETDIRGQAFGVLGLDGDDRVVWYSDDGMLYFYPFVDGEVVRDTDHPEYDSEWLRHTPHHGEAVVMSRNTADWNWIHPRYRWVTDHATAKKVEIEYRD